MSVKFSICKSVRQKAEGGQMRKIKISRHLLCMFLPPADFLVRVDFSNGVQTLVRGIAPTIFVKTKFTC